jgi:hypothetical protein
MHPTVIVPFLIVDAAAMRAARLETLASTYHRACVVEAAAVGHAERVALT